MNTSVSWHSISIESLSGHIMVSGQITRSDRYQIKAALLEDALSEADQILINRLLYGIRHGLLQLVD